MGTIATLNDIPLLGSSSIQWRLQAGVKPVVETFDMIPADSVKLLNESANGKSPVILTIISGNTIVRVKNLWVLNVYPGENKYINKVVVADRRWMWSYAHVRKMYNIHRHFGTRRPTVSNQAATNPLLIKWQYARWSLKNNQDPPASKWTAKEMIDDVFKDVQNIEKDYHGDTFSVLVSDGLGNQIKDLPMENIYIDDTGDVAIARAMAFLPEADLYVDYYGDIVVYSKMSGSEATIVAQLGPEIVGRGHTMIVNNQIIRPKEIEVLFTREVEVRFDFFEKTVANSDLTGSTVTTPQPAELGDKRYMENVLPVPDFQIPAFPAAPEVVQGTYITFDQAFQWWGLLPNPFGGKARKLDHDLVQKAFMPYMDLWAQLGIAGQFDYENDWSARIVGCSEHYRRTFRVNSRWIDKVYSFRPYRVSVVDQSSGQRAPAAAYTDYALLYTMRSLWKDHKTGLGNGPSPTLNYAINMTGIPLPTGWSLESSGPPPITSTSRPAPAIVTIPDSDQGIIHIDYILDPNRLHEMILPSNIVQSAMPHGNLTIPPGQGKAPIAFNAIVSPSSTFIPRLSPDFKASIIVTVIPSSPNSIKQLHKVIVKPSDIENMLPDSLQAGLGNAQGPKMQIRIGAGVETARIAWDDARADDICAIFGLDKNGNISTREPNLSGLVINEDTSGIPFGASINGIAKAEAARLYATMTDRFQGSKTGDLTGIEPGGWASSITHEVSTKGDVTTHIELPEKIDQFNLMSLLDSNSRNILARAVQLGNS